MLIFLQKSLSIQEGEPGSAQPSLSQMSQRPKSSIRTLVGRTTPEVRDKEGQIQSSTIKSKDNQDIDNLEPAKRKGVQESQDLYQSQWSVPLR